MKLLTSIGLCAILAQQLPPEVLDAIRQLEVATKRLSDLATTPSTTVRVAAGDNLQTALDSVPIGGTVLLQQGATFTGNFSIRRALTLSTEGVDFGDRRVTPDDDTIMAKIVSPNVLTALDIAVSNVAVLKTFFSGHSDDLITCGQSGPRQTTTASVPRNIRFDQVRLEGSTPGGTSSTPGTKRGIALHCADATVTRSHIRGMRRIGQDTQAIGGWNGPGPFTIHNNYLEAAGENIMFGGASPSIPAMVPCGITITDNHLAKNLQWRGENWTLKNLLEFKVGCDIVVRGNLFENNWAAGQTGYALLITPVNPGNLPEAVVRDLLFENNVVRNTASGWQIIGYAVNQATRPSLQTRNISIRNNCFMLDRVTYGGQGWFLSHGGDAANVVIENNTIEQNGTMFIQGYGAPAQGFRFVGNIVKTSGTYGIQSTSNGTNWMRGQNWQNHYPGGEIRGNALIAFPTPANLPDNLHVSTGDTADCYGIGPLETYGRRR